MGRGPVTSPTEQPTQTPSPTPSASGSPLDTTSWTAYESERFGWTIGHPADWTTRPAEHDWTLNRDAEDVMSSGQEMFVAPSGDVRVSAWSAPSNRRRTPRPSRRLWPGSNGTVEQASGASCTAAWTGPYHCALRGGIAIPAFSYLSKMRSRPSSGAASARDQIVVVTVWWGENEPAVAPYGGSQRLLEAFISTMAVWPESVPFEDRHCFQADADKPC